MNDSQVSNTPKIIGGSIAVIALVAMAVFYLLNHSDDATTARTTTTSSSTPASSQVSTATAPTSTTSSTSATYKDGSYSASANYMVPHGSNSITVKLTVKNGAIADVQTQNSYSDRESQQYISGFENEISSAVVGKKIDSLSLYGVSGASDTTQGFNDALQKIMSEAQA